MTDPIRALLKRDVESLERGLLKEVRDDHLTVTEMQDILSFIPDLHFPGTITVLAVGSSERRRRNQVTPFPLTKRNVAEALAHVSTKDETVRQATQLLLSGQFYGDMADAFAVISHTVPGLPLAIAQDIPSLPHFPRRLTVAIKRDLGDAPSMIEKVMMELREDGKIKSQPKLLDNTVRVLYRQATTQQIAKTIYCLLGNESVRLAIIVFARSKGVSISQADLDRVRKAIDPHSPNFGELLAPGIRQLIEHRSYAQAVELLEQFVA